VNEWCTPLDQLCALRPGWGDVCAINDDCPLGSFCVQGYCKTGAEVTPCRDNADCPTGRRCDALNLVCVEDLGCNLDTDCSTGEICDLATSRCVRACTPETQELICGYGLFCDAEGRCVECTRDDQCGVGLHCNLDKLRCEGKNGCFTSRDCDYGQVCNPQTLQCTVAPPGCLSNADCATGSVCDPVVGQCVLADCQPDAYEPNDQPDQAAGIQTGRLEGLNLCEADRDWFTIPLARGDRLQVIVNTDFLAADHFQIVLFDPEGQTVLQEDNLLLDTTVTRDGGYLLRAQTTDPRASYSLILTVSRGVPCDDDGLEPNDSAVQATILEPGVFPGLALCPRNEDWHVIERPLTNRLEVRIRFVALQGVLDLDLLAGDGQTLVMRSASAGDSQLVFADQEPGTRFFIRIFSDPQVGNRYELQADLLPKEGS
jgi:Cys-rich repeat protein